MSTFQNIKALIIEDDRSSIGVLRSLLDQLLISSTVIADTHNVEDHIATVNQPDIVFLDLEMPKNNGYAVLEMLRNNDKYDDVPIIAYTTHTSHLNQARDAGFDSLLGKPLDSRAFPEQLERILNGESIWIVP